MEPRDPGSSSRSNRLPRGARDLVGPRARARRAEIGLMLDRLASCGFELVSTPLLEYEDVLARGLGAELRQRTVRFFEPGTGEVVVLRPDLTPQIARVFARAREAYPTAGLARICYAGPVVRVLDARTDRSETWQVGGELIGGPEPFADVELIVTVVELLEAVGLRSFRVDLAHADVVGAVLAPLAPELRARLRGPLSRKDRDAVAAVVLEAGHGPAAARDLVELCGMFGTPARIRARVMEATESLRGATQALEASLAELERVAPHVYARCLVDLGEVRGFDYYTGLRVRVWAPGTAEPVVRGGRYDGLIGRFGPPSPACGFAVDLDALELALRADGGEPAGAPPGGTLFGLGARADEAARAAAYARARRLRERGRRVVLERIDGLAAAQAAALARGCDEMWYVDGPADPTAGPAEGSAGRGSEAISTRLCHVPGQGWTPAEELP